MRREEWQEYRKIKCLLKKGYNDGIQEAFESLVDENVKGREYSGQQTVGVNFNVSGDRWIMKGDKEINS